MSKEKDEQENGKTVGSGEEVFRLENKEQEGEDLPKGWKKVFDKNLKKHYYYNRKLNITTWEKPKPEAGSTSVSASTSTPEAGLTSACTESESASVSSEPPFLSAELPSEPPPVPSISSPPSDPSIYEFVPSTPRNPTNPPPLPLSKPPYRKHAHSSNLPFAFFARPNSNSSSFNSLPLSSSPRPASSTVSVAINMSSPSNSNASDPGSIQNSDRTDLPAPSKPKQSKPGGLSRGGPGKNRRSSTSSRPKSHPGGAPPPLPDHPPPTLPALTPYSGDTFSKILDNMDFKRKGSSSSPSSPPISSAPPFSKMGSSSSIFSTTTPGMPVLPQTIKNQIHKFRLKGYAKEFFSEQKHGFIFKRILSLDDVLSFSQDSITKPLLNTVPPKFAKEAIKNFDEILAYTGVSKSKLSVTHFANTIITRGNTIPEVRDEIYCQLCKQTSPAHPLSYSSSADKENDGKDTAPSPPPLPAAGLVPFLMKGWELFMMVTSSFPPSLKFEATLLNYLDHFSSTAVSNNTTSSSPSSSSSSFSSAAATPPTPAAFVKDVALYYSQYCLNALHNTTLFGGRSEIDEKRLNEIRGIKESTKQFNNSVMQIMFHQTKQAPVEFTLEFDGTGEKTAARTGAANAGLDGGVDEVSATNDLVAMYTLCIAKTLFPIPVYMYPIPKLIPILAVRTLQYVGVFAEGIFRKCINMQMLDQYIVDVDAGKAADITVADSHTYAVVLKTWLRKLVDPLIPDTKYKLALAFVKENGDDEEPEGGTYSNYDLFNYYNCNDGQDVTPLTSFVNKHLNPVHNLSLKYLIRFLRIFTIAPYVQTNLMHMDNIALVMAPNLIHLKTNDPKVALGNLQLEIKFMYYLLRDLCITSAEEALFESLDTSVRQELRVPKETSCSMLNYYVWGA